MTDTSPPKRRFWQIHLSTAVVLMIIAAAFIGANSLERKWFLYGDPNRWIRSYGWPCRMMYAEEIHRVANQELVVDTISGSRSDLLLQNAEPLSAVMNVAVAVFSCLSVVMIVEYLIRRRSKP